MTVVTPRTNFEKLIDLRMKEAKILLNQGEWHGAYYLAGYAVEFALKIRIISLLMQSDGYPEKKDVDKFYRHDLGALRDAAELKDAMDNDAAVSPQWDIVKDWSEQYRYKIGTTEQGARGLYDAIEKGVLPWIKARW